jgi:hypothetical protein
MKIPHSPTLALSFCAALSLALALAACQSRPPGASLTDPGQYFQSQVRPIFEKNCLRCHDGKIPRRLNLSSRATAFKTGPLGETYLVPGNPAASLLLKAVSRHGTHPKMMPKLDVSLTDDQIGILREWIEDGAHWPKGADGVLAHRHNPENP